MKKDRIMLDAEELELLNAIEGGVVTGSGVADKEIKRLAKIASDTLTKRKPINIRVFESDIYRMKRKALEEGISYQTLITSVIHKYANDTLVRK